MLYEELHQYNHKRVYSTTREIPLFAMKRLFGSRGVFRRFEISRPYQTLDDIFCYRFKKDGDVYRKFSWSVLRFSSSGVPIRDAAELTMSFNLNPRLPLIRLWCQNKLARQQQVEAEYLKKVHF